MRRNKAATLIELLVVVMIIAILAGIAVPNFLNAQVRSKISRTQSDMAMMQASLRAYYADYHAYPRNSQKRESKFREWWNLNVGEIDHGLNLQAISDRDPDGKFIGSPDDLPLDWCRYREIGTSGYDLSVITTPIAYLSNQLPTDPFCDGRGIPLVYLQVSDFDDDTSRDITFEVPRFVLLSYGPNTDSARWPFGNPYDDFDYHPLKGPFNQYDPTNGTISVGDIFLTGS